jgi:hypothetical protein
VRLQNVAVISTAGAIVSAIFFTIIVERSLSDLAQACPFFLIIQALCEVYKSTQNDGAIDGPKPGLDDQPPKLNFLAGVALAVLGSLTTPRIHRSLKHCLQ